MSVPARHLLQNRYLALCVFGVVGWLALSDVMHVRIMHRDRRSDFSYHEAETAHFLKHGKGLIPYASKDKRQQHLRWPHFLYPLTVTTLTRWFSPRVPNRDIQYRLMMFYLLTSYAIWVVLLKNAAGPSLTWLPAFLALALMFVGPINVFAVRPWKQVYYGWIVPNTYHNPTVIGLKPWAILTLQVAVAALSRAPRALSMSGMIRKLLFVGAIVLFGILAKPNHIITLLPALGLYALYRLLRGKKLNWPILLAVFATAVPTLLWQFKQTFQLPKSSKFHSSIVFAPLIWMERQLAWRSRWWLVPKTLLSATFPIAVYLLHFNSARLDTGLNLAWLSFFFGASYAFLLGESGKRTRHGNFGWSAGITLFLLFGKSAEFCLKPAHRIWSKDDNGIRRTGAYCAAIFAMHLLGGLLQYTVWSWPMGINTRWWH